MPLSTDYTKAWTNDLMFDMNQHCLASIHNTHQCILYWLNFIEHFCMKPITLLHVPVLFNHLQNIALNKNIKIKKKLYNKNFFVNKLEYRYYP